jgi:hypothetical protein
MKYQRLGVAEIGADARHNLDGNCKKQAGVDASRQHRTAAKGCRSAVKDLENSHGRRLRSFCERLEEVRQRWAGPWKAIKGVLGLGHEQKWKAVADGILWEAAMCVFFFFFFFFFKLQRCFFHKNEFSHLTAVKETTADAPRLACDEGGINWGLERDPSGRGARRNAIYRA